MVKTVAWIMVLLCSFCVVVQASTGGHAIISAGKAPGMLTTGGPKVRKTPGMLTTTQLWPKIFPRLAFVDGSEACLFNPSPRQPLIAPRTPALKAKLALR
mmetsp:Transcript_20842/g.49600  ORF Transcript_20842/g.49600 Transcript_20842/m.49600 type:complete len:100 (+) Transcript_20842:89-388(+)|eukprot:792150-Rhodomonas_salina.2